MNRSLLQRTVETWSETLTEKLLQPFGCKMESLLCVELCLTNKESNIDIDIAPRADEILDRFHAALHKMSMVGDGLPDVDSHFISSATERGQLSIAALFTPVRNEVISKLRAAFARIEAQVEDVKAHFAHFKGYTSVSNNTSATVQNCQNLDEVLNVVSEYERDIDAINSLSSHYVCGVLVVDATEIKRKIISRILIYKRRE